nr:pitrilysin family protein [Prochlorothrix hollandica]
MLKRLLGFNLKNFILNGLARLSLTLQQWLRDWLPSGSPPTDSPTLTTRPSPWAGKSWRSLILGLSTGVLILGLGGHSLDRAWASPLAPRSGQTDLQPYLDRVAQNITEFTLDNGLKFIVMERHQAPVVSFMTYADVGAVDEPDGKTGVAHFLEHLAFKGTSRIGTEDYDQERLILDRLDRVFEQRQIARQGSDAGEIDRLNAEFETLQTQAAALVRQNELGQIIEQMGGVGLNASTSTDATLYFYSLPANKLELWMSLESERFLDPVFREFYAEQQVILEERRMRLDNNPVNQLFDAVQGTAFQVHPYGRPVIGEAEDIANLSRRDVQEFFSSHYTPDKLTLAVVGDVDPQAVRHLAQRYFGRFQATASSPGSLVSAIAPEPPQQEPRSVTLQRPTQPWYVVAYHSPAVGDPDYVTCQVLVQILSSGRTSRLYRTLVDEQQIALAAQGTSGYPNDKYPNLLLFYALTAPGHSLDEVATALDRELEQIQREPVTTSELDRVKNQVRAGLLQSLGSNRGMAATLTEYEVKTGSWRNLFKELDQVAQLTPADLQRVAQTVLRPENRTVGRLVTGEAPTDPGN